MNIKPTSQKLAATAVAACIAATVLAPDGHATTSTSETLTFRGIVKARDVATLDVKPAGDSLGDRNIASMVLRRNGSLVGRLEGICTTVDNTYEGHMCTLVVILADGRIAFEGAGTGVRIPGVGGRGDVFALTGGTGRYVDAHGTLTVEPGENGDRIEIALR